MGRTQEGRETEVTKSDMSFDSASESEANLHDEGPDIE